MKIYKIAKGWAIFIYVGCPALIWLFAWLMIEPFLPNHIPDANGNDNLFLFISPPMIILMIIGILDTIKSKIIITHDTLSYRSTFINRDLKFDEILGFTINDKYYFVEPTFKDKKRIKISTYIGGKDEILEWLYSNFDDLDSKKAEEEEKEISEIIEFDQTDNVQTNKLQKAKLIAKYLAWAACISAIWILFYPQPYEVVLITNLIIPLGVIAALIIFKGFIRIDTKTPVYPSVLIALLFPSIALGLRAFLDFEIYDYSSIWIPILIISVVLSSISYWGIQELKFSNKNIGNILGFYFLIILFSYGLTITINCTFDKSKPVIFDSKVIDKEEISGKYTDYKLSLTPWGNRTGIEDVSVSENVYDITQKGDTVYVFLNKGLFNIKWINVLK